MSQTTTTTDETDSTESEYRISLTDIRGVGPKTVEKLETEGITTVQEVHLFRTGGAAYRNIQAKGVGSDTLQHLRAVGRAVHYTGGDSVEAEHITADFAEDEMSHMLVDISSQDTDDSGDENDSRELPEYSTSDLQSALDRIHGEYDEGYGGQVSFEGDVGKFLHESETFGSDDKLPTGIVQSVMRYRHAADRVQSQRDYSDEYTALLVQFSETL